MIETTLLNLWNRAGALESGPAVQGLIVFLVGFILLFGAYSLASDLIAALRAFASRDAHVAQVKANAEITIAEIKARADKDVAYYTSLAARSATPTPAQSAAPSTTSQFLKMEGDASDLAHGYVYVVKSGEHYKIGKTKNMQSRVREFSTGNPNPPYIVHVISTNAMTKAEALLHRHYAKQRGSGEWFTLADQDVANLKAIWRIDVKNLPVVLNPEQAATETSTNGVAAKDQKQP